MNPSEFYCLRAVITLPVLWPLKLFQSANRRLPLFYNQTWRQSKPSCMSLFYKYLVPGRTGACWGVQTLERWGRRHHYRTMKNYSFRWVTSFPLALKFLSLFLPGSLILDGIRDSFVSRSSPEFDSWSLRDSSSDCEWGSWEFIAFYALDGISIEIVLIFLFEYEKLNYFQI